MGAALFGNGHAPKRFLNAANVLIASAASAAFGAEDVTMFPAGQEAYSGRDTMIARYADWPKGATLSWTPAASLAGPWGAFG